ncbi:MAG: beta-galactosidase [Armatimonadetes bacterium]|nr:beta-galactosidase [Armatimonadota bacterium]MDW8121803.1 beta-galactosidase [Armatimonadota bacterium]
MRWSSLKGRFLFCWIVLIHLVGLEMSRAGANLVRNGSFEEGEKGPNGWVFWTRTTGIGEWDEKSPRTGSRCLKILSSNSNDNWSQRDIPLKPGYLHRFCVWVRQERCYAWGPDVVITAYDAHNQPLQSWQFRGRRGTRNWYPLEGYFVPPKNATKASIELRSLYLPQSVPVWFDDASLEPIGIWIGPTEQKDPEREQQTKFTYLRSLSSEIATPHFPWAKGLTFPIPLKIFFAIDRIGQREVIELAQRFPFDWHTVFITSDPHPQYLTGEYYDRLSHEELRQAYRQALSEECHFIVLSGSVWDALTEKERKETVRKIQQGTNLVYLGKPKKWSPDDLLVQLVGCHWLDKEVFARPINGSPLMTAYPKAMPPIPLHIVRVREGNIIAEAEDESGQRYPFLITHSVGKGRVLFVPYRTELEPLHEVRGPGLTPMFWRREISHISFAYHEYLLASLMKWLVSALQPDRWLIQSVAVTLSNKGLRATLQFPPYKTPLNIRWTIRDKFSRPVQEGNGLINPNTTEATIDRQIPDGTVSGPLFFEAIVMEGNSVLDWAAASTELKGVELAVELDKEVFDPEKVVTGVAHIDGINNGNGYRLHLQLVDYYGWQWERQDSLLKKTHRSVTFAVPLKRMRARTGVLIAKIRSPTGTVLAEDRKPFVVAARDHWDDWRQILWTVFGRSGYRPYLWRFIAEKLEMMGIDTCLFNIVGEEWMIAAQHNFYLLPIGIYGPGTPADALFQYATTKDKKWLIREPCMSSPQEHTRLEESVRRIVNLMAPFSPIAYCLTDESSVTYYNAPFDFCFSPYCLERMRQWLRQRYGDLSILNREWGRDFASWDEVVPDTFEEARERQHWVSWTEHRQFMDSVFIDLWERVRQVTRQGDPKARIALSGTQPPEAYGGYDWFALMETMGALLPYLGISVGEMQRSFSSIPRAPWMAGYGSKGPDLFFSVWRAVFNRCNGIGVFWQPSMMEPDLTLPQAAKDLEQVTRPLRTGLGKLLIHAQPAPPQVALYHSMASLRAAFALGLDDELAAERDGLVTVLQSLGISFAFVDARQLEKGWLKQTKVKALLLPMALAMSDEEVRAVQDFVVSGGKVIADVLPAIFDEKLRPRDPSPLADLFEDPHPNLLKETNPFDLREPPEATGPIASRTPGVLARRILLAHYTNDVQWRGCPAMEARRQRAERWIETALRWAGVSPLMVAQWDDGDPVRDCLWAEWDLGGGAKIVGVLRQPRGPSKGQLKVSFSKGVKVYSVLEEEAPSDPQVFVKLWALLPRDIEKPTVRVLSGSLTPGQDADLIIEQPKAPSLTVFRLKLTDREGVPLRGLSQNIVARNGSTRLRLSLPHNLPSGWRLVIRDVLTHFQTGVGAE